MHILSVCVCVLYGWWGGGGGAGLIDEIAWLVYSCMPVIFIYIVLEC